MKLFFFVLTFILGAIIVSWLGVSVCKFILAVVGLMIALTLIRILIGFQ